MSGPGPRNLRLRPLHDDAADERQVRAAHEAMRAERFEFALGLDAAPDWSTYVATLARYRRGDVPPHLVRAAFLVAVVGDEIVGRASIRFELNDFLAREGGHIGYGVVAAHRRRGYATEMLRQSLIVARSEGVDRVLVTCDDGNVGSATVIERCGGILQDRIPTADDVTTRRYWIE
jgi:predicted acetyltransferase